MTSEHEFQVVITSDNPDWLRPLLQALLEGQPFTVNNDDPQHPVSEGPFQILSLDIQEPAGEIIATMQVQLLEP